MLMLAIVMTLLMVGLMITVNGLVEGHATSKIHTMETMVGGLMMLGSMIVAIIGSRALWHAWHARNTILSETSTDREQRL